MRGAEIEKVPAGAQTVQRGVEVKADVVSSFALRCDVQRMDLVPDNRELKSFALPCLVAEGSQPRFTSSNRIDSSMVRIQNGVE
jgi:hypothetical protein